ncbi:uncharacterized protein EI90DRAFT_3129739 [Cantharellus anzutake]|uniref:uncharacterized protein n=1 Tax=Cantharellus anzutake TaxID=1750568 RepID=UPI001907FE4B|nr:uncharacterized protein EI90DRAFT_3129739 [Cantharellus anzutake]KAF8324554.1 hypothetical protein EI90DRAFT_3129739 [Cantharellus anzutake]
MPAISAPAKILVTGASGYVGAWVVKVLVDRGYSVLATTRYKEEGEFLVRRFPSYKGKVEYTIIPDIQKAGAFDEAVRHVEGIVHCATPVRFTFKDHKEILGPAIRGTIGLLESASKYGANIRRIIFSSTAMAVYSGGAIPPVVFDERIYNEYVAAHVRENGRRSNPYAVYVASKLLAEQAAWKWMEEKRPSFDFVSALSTWNWGPFINNIPSADHLSSSLQILYDVLATGDDSGELVGDFVDVRDSALLHVLSLETQAAGGERVIFTSESFSWQEMLDAMHDAGVPHIPNKGTYGQYYKDDIRYSNSKSLRLFPGFRYRNLKESAQDTGRAFNAASFL